MSRPGERGMAAWAVGLALLLLPPLTAPGYYHFLHYPSAIGPYEALPEKFDLDALIDDTVLFYLSGEPPRLAVNDTYAGLISQVRLALSVWDRVPTSSLRVGFGGVAGSGLRSQTPAGEIIFAELPPGVIALGGPVTRGEPRGGFVPIVRSQVILSNDLSGANAGRPSFSEEFFTSLVHEIGHALGLQHTMTGAAMSTAPTRATTRAHPLAADDIAGLSALYPVESFDENFGSLSGRVTARDGRPVALASVVALGPRASAVSALTGPDGRYRIGGLLPGEYLIYAHALPPATQEGLGPANIVLPRIGEDDRLAAGAAFRTVFYGGTPDAARSPRIAVAEGQESLGVDFTVEPRQQLPLDSVTTFSFPGNRAPGRHPAFLDLTEEGGFVLATAAGPAVNAPAGVALSEAFVRSLEPELSPRQPRIYERDPRFASIGFDAAPFAGFGPRHLLFGIGDEVYVLPAALHLAPRPAPVIHWMIPSFDPQYAEAWTLWTSNLDPRAQVFCDGVSAEITRFDRELGEIDFLPPPAPPGHRAVVTVTNPDGQSSAFTLPDGNIVYEYPEGRGLEVRLRNASSPPDRDVVVEVEADGFWLDPNDIVIGFGASDIVTRNVEVAGANRLRAVVTVGPQAPPGEYPVTLVSGLQFAVAGEGFRVESELQPEQYTPRLRFGSLVNAATQAPDLSPGVLASLFGENLVSPVAEAAAAAVRVTIAGVEARLLSVSAKQINLIVPETLSPGSAEVRVFNGTAESEAMLVQLERVSPGIFMVLGENGAPLGGDEALAAGSTAVVVATGLTALASPGLLEGLLPELLSGVQVVVGGRRVRAQRVEPAPELPAVQRVVFEVPQLAAAAAPAIPAELLLIAGGKVSNAVSVRVSTPAPVEVEPPGLPGLPDVPLPGVVP